MYRIAFAYGLLVTIQITRRAITFIVFCCRTSYCANCFPLLTTSVLNHTLSRITLCPLQRRALPSAVVDCQSSAIVMAAPEVYSLAQGPITAHSFNQERTRESQLLRIEDRPHSWARSGVAVSLNSKDVQIFSKVRNDWKTTETLSEVCTFRLFTEESRSLTVG